MTVPAPAQMPVTVQRQQDGRHAVIAQDGTVMGMHNSVWSAARQMHNYFGGGAGGDASTGTVPVEQGDVEPGRVAMEAKRVGGKQSAILERPQVPHPPKDRPTVKHPVIPKP